MGVNTVRLEVKDIINNKELMKGIANLNLDLEPSIEYWIENNGLRIYKNLTIDVIIDAKFECVYHFGVTYKDMGEYYQLILPSCLEGYYEGIEKYYKDYFKVYKNNMESRLKSECAFIIEANDTLYYMCIDEN